MVGHHRGHQLVVGVAVLCAAALIAAALAGLGPVENGSQGAGTDESSAPAGQSFSSSVSVGEDLLDSAFDLAGIDGQGPPRSWEAASLEEGASWLLDQYAQDESCALAQSGYLDLQGRVWGCVVVGESWADICVVKQGDTGEEAQVFCWRIDQDSVAREIGE